jgi:dolichol-phosphate mannosyltransferase
VGEIVVEHRERQHGRSKYGVTRIVKGFLDLLTVKFLTGFGQRPQHLLGTVGILFFLLGGLVMAYLSLRWGISRLDGNAANDFHLHASALFFFTITLVLLGSQLMSMGFLAELITAYQSRDLRAYSIADRVGDDDAAQPATRLGDLA